MEERKCYIDNLRWITILLLFPFHAAQIWSGGEYSGFYIWSHTDSVMYAFSTAVYPWFMTLLFILAGMGSRYSLQMRTTREFVVQRIKRLLVPFVFGILFLVPVMTYIGESFFNGYTGNYLQQYVLFFTKPTDLTGYKGGFTPGHLWFLLFLLMISLLSLLLIRLQKKVLLNFKIKNISYPVLLFLFIPEWLAQYVLNLGGKSVGQFLFLYLVGYYFFTEESIMQKVKEYRFVNLGLWIVSGCIYTYLYCFENFRGFLCTGLFVFFGWMGILAFLGIGQSYLNFTNKIFNYFRLASYQIYIIHLPVLVLTGYFVLRINIGIALQFGLIILISFISTLLIYEIVKRIPFIRALFGIQHYVK